jgi:hypothetical protein
VKENAGALMTTADLVSTPGLPPFSRPAQLAELTGTTTKFWAELRQRGEGPEYVKASRKVVLYPAAAVQQWFADRSRRSTSDATASVAA